MTCIVGISTSNGVLLGADTYGSDFNSGQSYDTDKIFVNGNFLIGCTTSFRMIDLLRYKLSVNVTKKDEDDLDKFFRTKFIDAVIEMFDKNKFIKEDEDNEASGGDFLVAFGKKLVHVQSDFAVLNPPSYGASIGCGDSPALGSLHTTSKLGLGAHIRATLALQAAEIVSPGVRGPFRFLNNFK